MGILIEYALKVKGRPTQRALDAGESARFSSNFLALAFFSSDGVPPPAPAQVTQTVRWNAAFLYSDARQLSRLRNHVLPSLPAVQVACHLLGFRV